MKAVEDCLACLNVAGLEDDPGKNLLSEGFKALQASKFFGICQSQYGGKPERNADTKNFSELDKLNYHKP